MHFDFTISIDDNIHDPLAMGQVDIVRQILSLAEEVTVAGRKVIVQHQFTNAPPIVITIFTNPKEVQEWRKRLDAAQAQLGRESISIPDPTPQPSATAQGEA